MIKLFKFFKGSAVICAILAPLVMILEVAMDLLQPTLLSNIIDIGVANHDLNYVLITGLKMIIAAIVGLFAGGACSFLAAIASIKLAEEVRQGLFDKIQTLSFLELDKLKTSSLITRLTNEPMSVPEIMIQAIDFIIMQNRIYTPSGKSFRRISEVAEDRLSEPNVIKAIGLDCKPFICTDNEPEETQADA